MDIKALAGKPLVAVLNEICLGLTPRWKTEGFGFDIFDRQTIIGPGHRGILILRTYETAEDRQHTVDYNAIKAALEPLILAIKKGSLVVLATKLPDDGSEPKPILLGNWNRQWKIDLSESPETFTVVDASGASTVFEMGTLEFPRLSGEAPAAEMARTTPEGATKKNKGGRPQEYNWSGAEIALTSYFNEQGPPMAGYGERAKAEKFMAAWFERKENGGKAPTESLIRDHVTKVVEILERERKRPKTQFPAFPADKKR